MATLIEPISAACIAPCACRLPVGACFCRELQPVATKMTMRLLMHQHEKDRSSNTGLLAHSLLQNSDVALYGSPNGTLPLSSLLDHRFRQVVLFPGSGVTLSPEFAADGLPLQLIIPDGNWRQGRRMSRSLLESLDVTSVSLPTRSEPSRYRLRTDKRNSGLATAEALAAAYAAVGEFRAATVLEDAFLEMVERVMLLRQGGLSPERAANLSQGPLSRRTFKHS